MIVDIFNEVYTALKTEIGDNAIVERENTNQINTFPCITLNEISDENDIFSRDSSGDVYSIISYEINIYSNTHTNFTEVRKLKVIVDNVLGKAYNMNRVFSNSVPNYLDTSIYRYIMRYSFKIDKNKKIYRS